MGGNSRWLTLILLPPLFACDSGSHRFVPTNATKTSWTKKSQESAPPETLDMGANQANHDSQVREEALETGLFGLATDLPVLLPFEKRLARLTTLVDPSVLSRVSADRVLHGAYDFGKAQLPALSWTVDSLESWSAQMGDVCASPVVAKLLPTVESLPAFFQRVLGRAPDAHDEEALAPLLKDTTLTAETKRKLVCQVVLSSSEFNFANAQRLKRDGSAGQGTPVESNTTYLNRIGPMLVGRLLNEQELNIVRQNPTGVVERVVRGWTQEPEFEKTLRDFSSKLFLSSGKRDGINLDEPGNLMVHIAQKKLPFQKFYSADFCVDDLLRVAPCDSGAPTPAGVLTSRAFLSNTFSRFNLKRARKLAGTLLCADYPVEEKWQTPISRDELIPMFSARNAEEAAKLGTNTEGFGNGTVCYSCHGQFAAHSQFFVRFDVTGKFVADATGLQSHDLQEGESRPGLATSHFKNPELARSDMGSIGQKTYANIQDAAVDLVNLPRFWQCQVKHVLAYTLSGDYLAMRNFPEGPLQEVANHLLQVTRDPTPSDLFTAVLSSEKVVESVLFVGEKAK